MSAKLRRHIFVLAVAAWAAGATGSVVLAADQPAGQSLVVVVVDTSRVLQESKAGKMIQSQMQQQVGTYQKSITKQDEELSTAQQDLQRQEPEDGVGARENHPAHDRRRPIHRSRDR